MSEALSIMFWPLIACLLLPGILVYYGLHIVRREIIFVDLALAQVAALGLCLAILLKHEPHDWQAYGWSLGFTFIGAAIFTLTRSQDHRVPQEALIGIVYVVAAAAAILLLSQSAEGDEELKRTLVGDILLVRPGEVFRAFGLYVVIGIIHFVFRKRFLMLSFEPERAIAEGLSVRGWDFLFYVLFGFVVTSFVHIGGVLMIFSYLIVPAICANLLAESLSARLLIGWLTATLASVVGLYFSYQHDLPTGASIVCALGAALVLVGALSRVRPAK
ncbi:MAG TPA: metal ABC transporter permease [Candidatus Limnocylindrales bacterium]|jgi:zinc/manganese transport system permease protein|nr:metal ABC transporter permease [Candidatus Limnocylindrales bacterium]